MGDHGIAAGLSVTLTTRNGTEVTGSLLYDYWRPHKDVDERGNVTRTEMVPHRCGVDLGSGRSVHTTNGYKLSRGRESQHNDRPTKPCHRCGKVPRLPIHTCEVKRG